MRIALIRPSFGSAGGRPYRSPARLEPLALAVLAALTPAGHEVVAVDERLEDVPLDGAFDAVALSVCTFSARRAWQIADRFRARGIPVVAGGFHPTLVPDEAAQHVDAVAVGDAEGTWPRVVADLAAGRLQPRYAPPSPGPCEAVTPDRRVYRHHRYLPVRVVQLTRGCPRACEFCAIRAFYGGHTRTRPVDAVVDEIRRSGARRLFFADDNVAADRPAFEALLEALLPLGVRWSGQVDLTFADDPALVRLVARSGGQSLTLGFESLDPATLVRMGKAWNRADRYGARLARIRDAGLLVYGTFVFGYEGDGPDVFDRALAFALDQGFYLANFNPLQPLPGTPLHGRLEREGRLRFDRWWLDPTYRWHDALFRPTGMTPEQLTEGCRRVRDAFHATRSIARRFLRSPAHWRSAQNAALYLASNVVSRLDVRAKEGLGLGA